MKDEGRHLIPLVRGHTACHTDDNMNQRHRNRCPYTQDDSTHTPSEEDGIGPILDDRLKEKILKP